MAVTWSHFEIKLCIPHVGIYTFINGLMALESVVDYKRGGIIEWLSNISGSTIQTENIKRLIKLYQFKTISSVHAFLKSE